MAWKLNAQNNTTTDGLTRSVQTEIDLHDDNRMAELTKHFGEDAVEYLLEHFGEPTRVMGIAVIDDRPVMLGDCPCKGGGCRAAWGWVYNARDLNMQGHRGSLTASPCPHAIASIFDATTGEMIHPAPYGQNAEQFYRFQKEEWGDVDKIGLQNFMQANLATTENKNNSWRVDE